jgi:hypothetical protein
VAHAAITAGDAMVTLSLAGSLFFSVSVDAAVSKVLLYLVLSLAPFAVVAPLIGPWIDRFSGGRRWVVIGTCIARAAVAFLMAGLLDSLLLFPLAFTMLVLAKTYAVARASLVPEVVRTEDQLVTANARLSLIAGIAAILGQAPALLVRRLGPHPDGRGAGAGDPAPGSSGAGPRHRAGGRPPGVGRDGGRRGRRGRGGRPGTGPGRPGPRRPLRLGGAQSRRAGRRGRDVDPAGPGRIAPVPRAVLLPAR